MGYQRHRLFIIGGQNIELFTITIIIISILAVIMNKKPN